jgi:hypothetical protein
MDTLRQQFVGEVGFGAVTMDDTELNEIVEDNFRRTIVG